MKRTKIVIVVLIMSAMVFFISCPIINDYSAKDVTRDILLLPLPEKTEVIEEFSQAGKLVGNGNGMQYLGAVLIKSDLSLEAIDEHYSAYRKTQWNYVIEEQKTQNIDVIEHGIYSFKTDVSKKGYYIVYSWGNGIPPFEYFDLRGN